jgi:hypothetical protein
LKPFADAGLAGDLTVLLGVSTGQLSSGGCAGSHEGGTPKMTTGVDLVAGCRASDSEGDDGVAGGPSIDQILLANVPKLKSPLGGAGFANAIGDSRVDTAEIGAQCLSYGSNQEPVLNDSRQTIQQNHPNMPTLSPLTLYNNLFMNFVPATGPASADAGTMVDNSMNAALIKKLAMKKSVLDFALEEINQMSVMAPSVAKNRLDTHAGAIRDMESSLNASITNIGTPTGGGGGGGVNPACTTKPMAPPAETGSSGSPGNQYGTGPNGQRLDLGTTDDGPLHQRVAAAHMDVLRAAMVCDIIRVGSFQFSPGTNHLALKGFFPNDMTGIYQHHPVSHRIGTADTTAAATLAALPRAEAAFLFNVQVWYFGLHAANLVKWKTQMDGFGNSLLDYTVVPFITEVRATGHEQSGMPAMIFGGKALGFIHNKYMAGNWTVNQYFGTLGQAFGYTNKAPVGAPIAGVWNAPA